MFKIKNLHSEPVKLDCLVDRNGQQVTRQQQLAPEASCILEAPGRCTKLLAKRGYIALTEADPAELKALEAAEQRAKKTRQARLDKTKKHLAALKAEKTKAESDKPVKKSKSTK